MLFPSTAQNVNYDQKFRGGAGWLKVYFTFYQILAWRKNLERIRLVHHARRHDLHIGGVSVRAWMR